MRDEVLMENKSFIFKFSDVEVREREFSLAKAGEVLAVEPKAFRVLLMLLRNPQKLISKEELLNAVWGDAAVTENSLTRSIALLRRLLGDEARDPRYIETVATVGYRWVCKVEVSEEGSGEAEAAEAPVGLGGTAKRDGSRRRLWGWVMAEGGVLVLCLAGVIWYLHRPLPPPRVTEYTQLTHDGHPKILAGADGSRLYFTQTSSWSVAQVAISGGEIAQVPVALPNPQVLDVSPDGSNLLVRSGWGGWPRLTIWNVRVLESSVRRLAEADAAAFSPDGNSVAYVTVVGDIYLARSNGTGIQKLASPGYIVRDIAWSRDGSAIRFTMKGRIWEISSNGSNLHPLFPSWPPSSEACCGRWTPDGKFFLFLAEGQIWALDQRRGLFRRPPAVPIQLTDGPIRWGEPFSNTTGPRNFRGGPIPSGEGGKIFAVGVRPRGELSRLDARTGQFQPFLGGISAQGVVFSRDGKSVAYVSYPEGTLWKANRDGSSPVQLTDPPIQAYVPRWSPDGTKIVFLDLSSFSSLTRITGYIVSAEGGSPRALFPEQPDVIEGPDWSPDGHKVVFSSAIADGTDIRILDLDNRQVTIIPGSAGMFAGHFSPDGRYLTARTNDVLHMKVFDFKAQQWSDLQLKGPADADEWSRDSQFIYIRRAIGDPGVFRIRVSGGAEEKIADLQDWQDAGWWREWMGLDPSDAPLLLRDVGGEDIYALTLEEK